MNRTTNIPTLRQPVVFRPNDRKPFSRYAELDGLRGLAALMVLAFHLNMVDGVDRSRFNFGVTGVDLFFMISGFVIFMSVSKLASPLEFAVNRFCRLFPTYWTCVTLTFIAIGLSQWIFSNQVHMPWWKYVANMTMFQYYLRQQNIDGAYWSLIVELLFYICIGFLMAWKKLNRIVMAGILFLFSCIFLDLVLVRIFPLADKIHGIFPLFTHFPMFFAGILFYRILHSDNSKEKGFYYVCLSACFGTALLMFDKGGRSKYYIGLDEYAVALLIYFIAFTLFVNGKLRFVANRPLVFVGKISYALYLIHQYISIRLLMPCFSRFLHLPFAASACLTFGIVLLLATAITYWVEIPSGRLLKKELTARIVTTVSLSPAA